MTKDEALKLALEALEIEEAQTHYPSQLLLKAIATIKQALANDALEKKAENARELGLDYEPDPVEVDQATMELAESVGLIGPTSRTHDLHYAIQRFHDLICVNATIKAAQMAANAIREATSPAQQEPVAWGVFEGNLHDMFFTEAEAVEMAQLKGTHAEVKPLYTKENT